MTVAADAALARLRVLAPNRAESYDNSPADVVERRVRTSLAVAMEKFLWTCPCGEGGELTVASNLDAPIPNPPTTVHNDEGQPIGFCSACGEPLELPTLVPTLVWHVAQAGVFGVVAANGDFQSADSLENSGGTYVPFRDPANAVKAATRAQRRDPDDLIQIIPEARLAPGAR